MTFTIDLLSLGIGVGLGVALTFLGLLVMMQFGTHGGWR
jgi:hypothetical protein